MAEKRRDLPVPVKVVLTRPGGERTTEYAINLSAGGACLQVRDPLSPGERVGLAFELPGEGGSARLEGTVVWCEKHQREHARFCEMGVQFRAVDGAVSERLARFAAQAVDSRR
ncbi:MAG: PilZ domain-containing protein [Myxococcota bacterium]